MGLAAWWLDRELHLLLPGMGLAVQIARVGLAITGALGVLALFLKLLRVTEFTDVAGTIQRRLGRRRS